MRLLPLLPLLLLSGCADLPTQLRNAIPDGTYQKFTASASASYGTFAVSADGLTKAGPSMTATDIHYTLNTVIGATVDINAQGFASPAK